MKKIITIIVVLFAISCTASAQRYQMDVKLVDGTVESYLLESISDLEYQNGTTLVKIDGVTRREFDNREIETITWNQASITNDGNGNTTAQIDVNHTTVITPDYSVTFLPGTITQTSTLSVTKAADATPAMDNAIEEMKVYDFNLSGQTTLNGFAEIRLPMKQGENDEVFGSYYNQETGKWEAIDYTYDELTGEVVITTSHFSRFGAFRLMKSDGYFAKLQMLDDDNLLKIISKPAVAYVEIADMLKDFAYSNNPDAAAIEAFSGKYSDATQLGIDFAYNGLKSLNLYSDFFDDLTGKMGNLGTLLSVYQIIRNDYRNEKVQLAGNTMKLCMSQVVGNLASACATNLLYAGLASVAIIDYSINKFGQYAWSGRKDTYKLGYDLYMQKECGDYLGDNGWRWVDKIAPYFQIGSGLTAKEINKKIDDEVRAFTNKPWTDPMFASYFYEATGKAWAFTGGENKALEEELSGNLRASIYRDDIPGATLRLKKEIEDKIYSKLKTALASYTYDLNKGATFNFYDSSFDETKDKKSEYAGYTVRFKNHPEADLSGKYGIFWDTELDDKGRASLQMRVGIFAILNFIPEFELVSPDGKVINTVKPTDIKAGYSAEEASNAVDIAVSKPVDYKDLKFIGKWAYAKGSDYYVEYTYNADGTFTEIWDTPSTKRNNKGVFVVNSYSEDESSNVVMNASLTLRITDENGNVVNEVTQNKVQLIKKKGYNAEGDLVEDAYRVLVIGWNEYKRVE